MSLTDIHYFSPQSVSEALQLLSELEEARLLAGGTDLIVDLKQGQIQTRNIVSLQGIEILRGITEEKGRIRIGALVTPAEISESPILKLHNPALSEAAGSMSSAQIRSMATVGGNIASAVPSADLPPSLIAAEATLQMVCSDSAYEVALADFFTGPRQTVCGAGEIITGVFVPIYQSGTGFSYQKFTLRDANALAVASAAVRLTLEDSRIQEASIVLGAVSPVPMRAEKANEILVGKTPSDDLFQSAALLAEKECQPISDIRGSDWHRRELIRVLTVRALCQARERALGKTSVEELSR
ncbi:FAD binding domain-containing protein [Acidobacteriota bacterium]